MHNFEYEIAISFAGEQRVEAEAIAKCLRSANVKVFYDDYEKAALWGKNLYEHLADVYQNKARYCLILVSASYAAKVWTTHERRSAQARALEQKSEYILPVRFDETEIPGLPSTVGYVRFQDHGPEGICSLLMEKLVQPAVVPLTAKSELTTSPRVCILDPDQNLQAYIPVIECTWDQREATVTVQPDDPTDGPFLDGLRDSRRSIFVAFKHNIGKCRVQNVIHTHKAGIDQWAVHLNIEESDFTPTMEMSLQGLTADDLAEQRARRILLDEYPFVEGKGRGADLFNDVTRELFVQGINVPIKPKRSPFPALYERYGHQPNKFLEIAWITAVLLLKTTGVVAEVTRLKLVLNGAEFLVSFAGKRRKQYTNKPVAVLAFDGALNLSNRP